MIPYPSFWTRATTGALTRTDITPPWHVIRVYRSGTNILAELSTGPPDVTLAALATVMEATRWLDDLALRLLVETLTR